MANQIDVSILDFFSKTGNSQRIAEIHKVYTHIMDYVSGILECSEPSELKKISTAWACRVNLNEVM